jgi:TRAP-type C4-dicarboxylate transport system substrate-binding protein
VFAVKKRLVVLLCIILSISLILAGCGGKSGNDSVSVDKNVNKSVSNEDVSVKWIANSVWPPNNHITEAFVEYASKVKEATEGRVDISVQSGGALGYTGAELLSVVRDNLVPVTCVMASGAAGDEPLFDVTTLPFLLRSIDEVKILTDISRDYYVPLLENKWNQKLLMIAPWTPAGFWTKRPLNSVADMKGLKTRTYDRNGALVMQAVGGTPYPLPFSEVYSSLATGVIDSVLTSTPTAVDAKFWEVLDYYSPVFVTMGIELFTVNMSEFNKLSAKDQETMKKIAEEMEIELWSKAEKMDKDLEKVCIENGIKVVEPSDEFLDELAAITENIRNEWLSTAPAEAKEIVEKFNEAVGR